MGGGVLQHKGTKPKFLNVSWMSLFWLLLLFVCLFVVLIMTGPKMKRNRFARAVCLCLPPSRACCGGCSIRLVVAFGFSVQLAQPVNWSLDSYCSSSDLLFI